MPAATASSTPYWMMGLSTSGSISFGCALVAGRKRVPSPAAGNTALRITLFTRFTPSGIVSDHRAGEIEPLRYTIQLMLDPAYVRDHMDAVREGLRNRG